MRSPEDAAEDGNLDEYVDRFGKLKAKHFKNKDFGDLKGTVLNELDSQAARVARLEEERRKVKGREEDDPDFDRNDLLSRKNLPFYWTVFRYSVTGFLLPLLDMGLDLLTAGTHFYFGDVGWGILTLVFVWLPGFVCAVVVAIRGLWEKMTAQRIVNYLILLVVFPFLYPIIQILVNLYMLYLVIVRRSRDVVKVMGHDVKQFKSLEGFLESAPQFVLQAYILMRSKERGFGELEDANEFRIMTLICSIFFSFLSLTKTGFNVNVPDPDPRRQCQQYKENSPKFKLTSVGFHAVCVLFRVTCLAYFFAAYRAYAFIIILLPILDNVLILHFLSGAWYTVSVLLGTISIFMPNGYLLYNFAGTFPVDFTFEGTKRFFAWHMLTTTPGFIIAIVVILSCDAADATWLEANIADTVLEWNGIQIALSVSLLLLGLASIGLAFLHWQIGIVPLYKEPRAANESGQEDNEMRPRILESEA